MYERDRLLVIIETNHLSVEQDRIYKASTQRLKFLTAWDLPCYGSRVLYEIIIIFLNFILFLRVICTQYPSLYIFAQVFIHQMRSSGYSLA